MVSSFKELIVWQKAMDLVDEVYKIVKFLPKEEMYALSDQMRRAAVSIPSNIAEGQTRNSTKEFTNFLSIARGSSAELFTQIMLCIRLHYISEEQAEKALLLLDEVGKMLKTMIKKLSLEE